MKLGQETASANLQRSISNLSDPETTISLSNGPLSKLFGGKQTINSTLTGSIEFVNSPILRSSTIRQSIASSPTVTASVDYLEKAYKLIDLGTAVAVHEEADSQLADTMKTVTEIAFAG